MLNESKKYQEQFLQSRKDSFLILQLKIADETVYKRFMNLDWLGRKGETPQGSDYDVVYGGLFPPGTNLEDLYCKFNINCPNDFTGHSLSVSDIVALKQSGTVSYYYVDSVGFKKLEGFKIPDIPDYAGRES